MKLTDDLPKWIAWPLRSVLYALVMFILFNVAVGIIKGRVVNNTAICSDVTSAKDGGLKHAKGMVYCLRQKNGFLENWLMDSVYRAIDAMPNVPSEFTGAWDASQPRCNYRHKLEANGEFISEPMGCSLSADTFHGAWGVYDNQMIWLPDEGMVWPPDINQIDVVDKDFFLLVEKDGSRTKFKRISDVAVAPTASTGIEATETGDIEAATTTISQVNDPQSSSVTNNTTINLPTSANNQDVDFESVAQLLDGKLIIGGATFYRVSHASSVDYSNGTLTLGADVDPLFAAQYSYSPDGKDGDRDYYNVKLDKNASCGIPNTPTNIVTSDFLVFHGGEFVTPKEYIAQAVPRISINSSGRPFNRITSDMLGRLQSCADQVAKIADSMPFSEINLYTISGLDIAHIRRTTSINWMYTEWPGDSTIGELSLLKITPQNSLIENFTVEVRALSVMHCDYEGPHLELDDWKQGVSVPVSLKRDGNNFLIAPNTLPKEAPPFPAYKEDELRHAIAKHMGSTKIASEEESAPCAPFLRGYKFTVRHLSKIVQELTVSHAGGC